MLQELRGKLGCWGFVLELGKNLAGRIDVTFESERWAWAMRDGETPTPGSRKLPDLWKERAQRPPIKRTALTPVLRTGLPWATEWEGSSISVIFILGCTLESPGELRDDHSKWSKSDGERQIPYNITYMRNLKYDTNELICETETDSQT